MIFVRRNCSLRDSHLVNFIGTVCESTPSRLLQHMRQWRVGRITKCTVHLNCSINYSPQTISNEMFGHRDLGCERLTVLNFVRRMKHHQLALI